MRAFVAAASFLAAVGVSASENSTCTDAQKNTAILCAATALADPFADSCDTYRRQLACYEDGSCCVSATALKLRYDAQEAGCTDLPICAPSDCAAREIWEGIAPCVQAALLQFDGSICPTLNAATECLPEQCCEDRLVQDLAETSVSYDCEELMCSGRPVNNSGGVTRADETAQCLLLPEDEQQNVTQCLRDVEEALAAEQEAEEEDDDTPTTTTATMTTTTTEATAQVEDVVAAPTPAPPTLAPPTPAPQKSCEGTGKGTKCKTKTKGTKRTTLTMQRYEEQAKAERADSTPTAASSEGSVGRAGNTCEGLQRRMNCIPDCCCESDPLAMEIRNKSALLGCPTPTCGETVQCPETTVSEFGVKDGAEPAVRPSLVLGLLAAVSAGCLRVTAGRGQ